MNLAQFHSDNNQHQNGLLGSAQAKADHWGITVNFTQTIARLCRFTTLTVVLEPGISSCSKVPSQKLTFGNYLQIHTDQKQALGDALQVPHR
jgi:hypothetical protein